MGNTIIQGQVGAPSTTSMGDGAFPNILLGKQAEMVQTQLHGKYYTAAYRNLVFTTGVLIAGVTIPVNTTTAPTFTLFNPAGSGKNLELLSLDIAWPAAATTVVASLLGTLSAQVPTSVTAGNVYRMPFTGTTGGNAGLFYTAATITASTTHTALLNVTSTADQMTASHYDWDGRLILAPGTLFTLTSSPVQTGVALPTLSWAEFPI